MIVLSLKNVSRIYQMGETKLYALRDINLDIYRGEFVVVLGPSGSGKSTLLNMLGGTDRPSKGNIFFNNKDLSISSDRELTLYRRNAVGFIFQFYNLLPTLTALENVEVATEIAKEPLDARETLARVGLAEYCRHFPAQMSGGQQQRVAIARALASNPEMLLCDEPTGALDSQTGQNILQLLSELCKKMQKTVVLITHNQSIATLGDRVINLQDGRIVAIQAKS